MSRTTASEARKDFFHLLDAAERGEDVVLERHGVRFRIVREEARAEALPEAPLVVADTALLDHGWSWTPDDSGQLSLVEKHRAE